MIQTVLACTIRLCIMYQDLIKNHRLTEIDYINGAVWRKGQKYNVATPFCAMLTQLVHGKEELLGAK